jgi:hypothetical protein
VSVSFARPEAQISPLAIVDRRHIRPPSRRYPLWKQRVFQPRRADFLNPVFRISTCDSFVRAGCVSLKKFMTIG